MKFKMIIDLHFSKIKKKIAESPSEILLS